MIIGDRKIFSNNYALTIPAAPIIVDETVLSPMNEIVEDLGGTMEWGASEIVTIKMGQDTLIIKY